MFSYEDDNLSSCLKIKLTYSRSGTQLTAELVDSCSNLKELRRWGPSRIGPSNHLAGPTFVAPNYKWSKRVEMFGESGHHCGGDRATAVIEVVVAERTTHSLGMGSTVVR